MFSWFGAVRIFYAHRLVNIVIVVVIVIWNSLRTLRWMAQRMGIEGAAARAAGAGRCRRLPSPSHCRAVTALYYYSWQVICYLCRLSLFWPYAINSFVPKWNCTFAWEFGSDPFIISTHTHTHSIHRTHTRAKYCLCVCVCLLSSFWFIYFIFHNIDDIT